MAAVLAEETAREGFEVAVRTVAGADVGGRSDRDDQAVVDGDRASRDHGPGVVHRHHVVAGDDQVDVVVTAFRSCRCDVLRRGTAAAGQ